MELPDLSSVHLEARLDEADRGRLKVGQDATIRIEAIPGSEFKATIERISVLAKVDYSSGWPPARNFELGLVLDEIDPKIRPGMSAVARIATDRVPDVLLVPSEAIFQRDGHPVVYKLDGSEFDEQQIEVSRRGQEQAIVEAGVAPGDRVATRKPAAEMIRRNAMKRRRLTRRAPGRRRRCGAPPIAAITAAVPRLPDRGAAVPTAKLAKGPLKLTVHATGELRAGRTMTLVAPPVGGMLRHRQAAPDRHRGEDRATSWSSSIRRISSSRSSRRSRRWPRPSRKSPR